MRAAATLSALFVTAALGYGVARWTSAPESTSSGSSGTRVVERTFTRDSVPLDRAALREDLRKMIREELSEPKTDSVPITAVETKPTPTTKQQTARTRALELVASAIDARRLTVERAQELRVALSQLGTDDIVEVMGRLVPSINRQEIEVDPGAIL